MNQFEWLLGSVEVNAEAPEDWKDRHILPFWDDPNNDAWGTDLSRYLTHETIHFWQLLSSSYLLERLLSEWMIFSIYRDTGEVVDDPVEMPAINECKADDPFSAFELMECWARFWDIHTRSPAAIIEEEGHQGPPGEPLQIVDPITSKLSYTQFAFDWLMQHGPDHSIYVRPYRWLLEYMHGNSRAAVACFPILVHAAFSTEDPVRFFCSSVEAVDRSLDFQFTTALQIPEYSLINRLWFYVWKSVVTVVMQCSKDLDLPIAWGIDQVGFHGHPVYQSYPWRFEQLVKVLGNVPRIEPEFAGQEEINFSAVTRYGVFALPGIPIIRRILGNYMPPPRIRFANFNWYADLAVPGALGALEKTMSGNTVCEAFKPLDDDIESFREAQWMAREGLSAG
ncbi:MAG: hypothetical protein JSW64_12985 [Candidatus Zixiibacteriota bacterium]|nr:MAG: hypothetical protein JSW64_12985 [candidate division Zixibacteria bacterium]